MKNKVLFISSANPLKGPGAISMDYYEALKLGGYDVDFLTLFKVKGYPKIRYIYSERVPKRNNIWFKINKKLGKFKDLKEHYLFYMKETQPPVPKSQLLSKIDNNYDLIVIFFWQNLLSFDTLKAIYDYCTKKPKVIFIPADYSPMTGGCHFPGKCENFKVGCGNCPILSKPKHNDFTSWNFSFRKKVIGELKPQILLNTYMENIFSKSPVIKSGAVLNKANILINTDLFKPLNRNCIRAEYNIPTDKRFIILFGCQDFKDPRKGMKYLIRSLQILWEKLSAKERDSILLVSLGKDDDEISKLINFQRIHLGYVDKDTLIKMYSLADVFVSPSINDAGPSMVNQSISCGTPVVAFEIGTAIDVIKNGLSGYRAPLYDSQEFALAINKIFHMSQEDYAELRDHTREIALKEHSYCQFLRIVNQIIQRG